jgi:hypothetical protein
MIRIIIMASASCFGSLLSAILQYVPGARVLSFFKKERTRANKNLV